MSEYRFVSTRIVDGSSRNVIVDICGDIINRNPTREELKDLRPELLKKEKVNDKDILLEFLRYFNEKEGRPPKEEDFTHNPRYPSIRPYIDRFGSWNAAKADAGLINQRSKKYTEEELLEFLRKFERENGRPPTKRDFDNNPEYPSVQAYISMFGNWRNALKLVCLDVDSMIRKGVIETIDQKRRLAEILILEHFDKKEEAKDLSGENPLSHYDGICPRGKPYDVKSSALLSHERFLFWRFNLDNYSKDEIEWYYLLAFDEDYSELLYVWRIPAWDFMEYIEKGHISIGINRVENMKQYEITEKIKPIFNNWLDKIQK